jgi:hypothetical protein
MTSPSTIETPAPSPTALKFKVGHAYQSTRLKKDIEDLEDVVYILIGSIKLAPRIPTEVEIVAEAEKALGLTNSPIYAFIGNLHPQLGTIGLIIKTDCLNRCQHGVSRCDSGGFIGRKGAFLHLPATDMAAALKTLSFPQGDVRWRSIFSDEVEKSYSELRDYLIGKVPRHAEWKDLRSACISKYVDSTGSPPDRRTWTWEVRLAAPPEANDYTAIVLSPEAFKQLEEIRIGGKDVPLSVRIIHGSISASGVHYFEIEDVVTAFQEGDGI